MAALWCGEEGAPGALFIGAGGGREEEIGAAKAAAIVGEIPVNVGAN